MINNKKRVQSILVMGFGLSLILASNVKSKDVLVSTVTPDTPMQKLEKQYTYDGVAGVSNTIKNIFEETKTTEIANIEPTIEKQDIACIVTAPNSETKIANKDVPYYTSMDSNEPIGYFNFNSEITYSKANENFGVVNIDLNNNDNENADDESESNVYFHLSDLSERNDYTSFEISSYPGTKTIESYTVFGKNTPQQRLQNAATTDEQGFRRLNNRYMVALGSRFTSIVGQYFDIVLANGTVIPCMLSDQKSDEHTDSSHTWTIANGSYCCSEFCVDVSKIRANGVIGDVSVLNGWDSRVKEIRVYNYNYFNH
ncbi:hypothetical protein [Agathobacter rectalis]|uniref:Uncharacterized protein n=1 Tax=Agathobacter rectalis TaxID=39491 RepID=A0A3E4YL21_9FIRM|nr:hypothetical protein [Agathobacter rectalis]RGM75400.1 hypothetical protein DXB99_02445 [Agathobacter rectalis]